MARREPADLARDLDAELSGLDALDLPLHARPKPPARRVWSAAWPKLVAVGLALLAWEAVVVLHWRPAYVLPGPATVFRELRREFVSGEIWTALAVTSRRALTGYSLAVVIGSLLGIAVSRARVLRAGIGSLITGLQTMPSIAWFPLAILLFKLSESAILFVVILGAAPSIANGVISGIDHIPPIYHRAGRVLGARGLARYRHIVIPAALPGFVAGLKQGWAFAWRSLMAGELLVIIAARPSIGVRLQLARELSDAGALMAWMIVILAIGLVVDAVFFGMVERSIRRRRGLLEAH